MLKLLHFYFYLLYVASFWTERNYLPWPMPLGSLRKRMTSDL